MRKERENAEITNSLPLSPFSFVEKVIWVDDFDESYGRLLFSKVTEFLSVNFPTVVSMEWMGIHLDGVTSDHWRDCQKAIRENDSLTHLDLQICVDCDKDKTLCESLVESPSLRSLEMEAFWDFKDFLSVLSGKSAIQRASFTLNSMDLGIDREVFFDDKLIEVLSHNTQLISLSLSLEEFKFHSVSADMFHSVNFLNVFSVLSKHPNLTELKLIGRFPTESVENHSITSLGTSLNSLLEIRRIRRLSVEWSTNILKDAQGISVAPKSFRSLLIKGLLTALDHPYESLTWNVYREDLDISMCCRLISLIQSNVSLHSLDLFVMMDSSFN